MRLSPKAKRRGLWISAVILATWIYLWVAQKQLDYYRTFISCHAYMQKYLTQNRPNHVRSKEFLKANPDLKNFFDDQLVEELRCEAVLIAEFPPERVYLIKIGEELSIFSIDSYENGQAN